MYFFTRFAHEKKIEHLCFSSFSIENGYFFLPFKLYGTPKPKFRERTHPITMHDRDGMMTLFLLQEMALNEVLAFLQKSSIKVETSRNAVEQFGEFKFFGGRRHILT